MVNADRGITCQRYGHNADSSALEIFAAKEAKRRFDCCGNHLGCPDDGVLSSGMGRGLQYGLSGNRATEARRRSASRLHGNTPNVVLKGNRLAGNGR